MFHLFFIEYNENVDEFLNDLGVSKHKVLLIFRDFKVPVEHCFVYSSVVLRK